MTTPYRVRTRPSNLPSHRDCVWGPELEIACERAVRAARIWDLIQSTINEKGESNV